MGFGEEDHRGEGCSHRTVVPRAPPLTPVSWRSWCPPGFSAARSRRRSVSGGPPGKDVVVHSSLGRREPPSRPPRGQSDCNVSLCREFCLFPRLLFAYSIVCFYRSESTGVYFTLWMRSQCSFTLLLRLFRRWPWERLPLTPLTQCLFFFFFLSWQFLNFRLHTMHLDHFVPFPPQSQAGPFSREPEFLSLKNGIRHQDLGVLCARGHRASQLTQKGGMCVCTNTCEFTHLQILLSVSICICIKLDGSSHSCH